MLGVCRSPACCCWGSWWVAGHSRDSNIELLYRVYELQEGWVAAWTSYNFSYNLRKLLSPLLYERDREGLPPSLGAAWAGLWRISCINSWHTRIEHVLAVMLCYVGGSFWLWLILRLLCVGQGSEAHY
jgi:hypothetical protein